MVIRSGQCHQVLTNVRLAITQCRTILHILARVVSTEVKVNISQRSIGTQVKNITTHVSLWYNIFVAHVSISKSHTCIAIGCTDNSGVTCGKSCTEELRGIIGYDKIRTFNSIKILQHVASVGLRAPALISVRHRINAISTVTTHTINILYVVPLGQLCVKSQRTVILYSQFLFAIGFLGGNQDNTVTGTATVKSSCCRSFKNRHILNVIGVNARNAIT
ncbi:hypothetical protein SDC9_90984 [bioreactor metagenome]|uniref:Uncharacterized protein n=1 Tax=bioreactor metagenome TaxID=1076179 RepID=A0A644ZUA3_9ZZZZ